MDRKRVVITGLGAVTALGSSVKKLWDGLVNGHSGIRRITHFDPSALPCQIAGEIPDFDPTEYMKRKEARRLPRSTQIAVGAAVQAVDDAGFPPVMPEPERTGLVFGTAMGGIDNLISGFKVFAAKGFQRLNPFVIPAGIPNLAGYAISERFQCLGPNMTITTACATGTQTIGEGAELIRRGVADVVITGGTEALVQDYSIAAFAAMRALPVNYNDNPEQASRPFDAKREGFVFSEGAAAVVIESLEHALKRGAKIYAEVLGHSSSTDGYHLAAPHPDGLGAIRTMQWALDDARIAPEEIDYINAHGSSTPLNDPVETSAIKRVFGSHAYKLVVSSTKSMLGHAMGASGAIEAIACALAIRTGIVPPTINYEHPDPACDLNYAPGQAIRMPVNIALSNSFGLGGQNACLVLKKFA